MPVLRYFPLLAALTGLPAAAVTFVDDTVQRPEGARHYLLARPAAQVAGKLPLIILLHGHTSSADIGRRRPAGRVD
ncbi:hypothetical protein GTP46_03205 [Duganella sp. FT135W]|uniref:Uncharacterized protein n=1 Tax=Duganella flavida TaxID=2692175 RepID=A0A6L8K2J5_9BURK|nr:hypothetical protein [Duganella flavida]MYM21656.1 hypothetical protein [Duganella flavida]